MKDTFYFAQVSDPHLSSLEQVQWPDLVNKRVLGYLSWRRRRRNEHRSEVLDALQQDLRQTAPEIEPVAAEVFAGVVLADTPEFKRLFPLMKMPVKAMAEQPDHRDWEAIRAWANERLAKMHHKGEFDSFDQNLGYMRPKILGHQKCRPPR
mgnify:CR=1 FL=1